jgi:hypothetical protein
MFIKITWVEVGGRVGINRGRKAPYFTVFLHSFNGLALVPWFHWFQALSPTVSHVPRPASCLKLSVLLNNINHHYMFQAIIFIKTSCFKILCSNTTGQLNTMRPPILRHVRFRDLFVRNCLSYNPKWILPGMKKWCIYSRSRILMPQNDTIAKDFQWELAEIWNWKQYYMYNGRILASTFVVKTGTNHKIFCLSENDEQQPVSCRFFHCFSDESAWAEYDFWGGKILYFNAFCHGREDVTAWLKTNSGCNKQTHCKCLRWHGFLISLKRCDLGFSVIYDISTFRQMQIEMKSAHPQWRRCNATWPF